MEKVHSHFSCKPNHIKIKMPALQKLWVIQEIMTKIIAKRIYINKIKKTVKKNIVMPNN